ncbi:LiaF transmembrane domain-containing protein [Halobacteriales archaeon Cl-PHB]
MAQQHGRLGLSTQLVVGALVVVIGLVLLVHTTGLYDTRFLFDYIPSVFVLLGLYAMVRSGFRNLFGPMVVVVLAGVWQLTELDVVEGSEIAQFWPLFIVLFGLSLVASHFRREPEGVADNHISTFAVFSGTEQRSNSKRFTGADLTAIFGGTELDLRDAEIAERPAHVSATALFGGVDVIVPRDWNVQLDVLPIFGGASDERPKRAEEHAEVDLVVTGFAAFGGVSIDD